VLLRPLLREALPMGFPEFIFILLAELLLN
jgi:hypothetical protein